MTPAQLDALCAWAWQVGRRLYPETFDRPYPGRVDPVRPQGPTPAPSELAGSTPPVLKKGHAHAQ